MGEELKLSVLGKLKKAFAINHFAEAFDVLLVAIDKQDLELSSLREKVAEVEVLQESFSKMNEYIETIKTIIPIDDDIPSDKGGHYRSVSNVAQIVVENPVEANNDVTDSKQEVNESQPSVQDESNKVDLAAVRMETASAIREAMNEQNQALAGAGN